VRSCRIITAAPMGIEFRLYEKKISEKVIKW
jgi:hypothetical protein